MRTPLRSACTTVITEQELRTISVCGGGLALTCRVEVDCPFPYVPGVRRVPKAAICERPNAPPRKLRVSLGDGSRDKCLPR